MLMSDTWTVTPRTWANSMNLALRPESSHAGKLNNLKLSLQVYCSSFS